MSIYCVESEIMTLHEGWRGTVYEDKITTPELVETARQLTERFTDKFKMSGIVEGEEHIIPDKDHFGDQESWLIKIFGKDGEVSIRRKTIKNINDAVVETSELVTISSGRSKSFEYRLISRYNNNIIPEGGMRFKNSIRAANNCDVIINAIPQAKRAQNAPR